MADIYNNGTPASGANTRKVGDGDPAGVWLHPEEGLCWLGISASGATWDDNEDDANSEFQQLLQVIQNYGEIYYYGKPSEAGGSQYVMIAVKASAFPTSLLSTIENALDAVLTGTHTVENDWHPGAGATNNWNNS